MKYIFQGILLTILFFLAIAFFKAIGSTIIYKEQASPQFFCGTSSMTEKLASASSIKGQQLFSSNCASCHALHKSLTGPALAGVELRWKSRSELYKWIHNPAAYMKKDAYTRALYKESGGVMMTPFPSLTTQEIDAILDYTSAPVMSY